MNYCPNCGSDIKPGEKFCPACGTMVPDQFTGSDPLPEKEIFPEQTGKKKNSFTFGAGSSKEPFSTQDKSSRYDPFGSDEAPKYSDYSKTDEYFKDNAGSRAYDSADSYESAYSSSAGDTSSETNGFAIASLILGICAILFDFLLFIPSVLAVIFGIMGLRRSDQTGTGHGMSVAGIVLGIIAFSFYIIAIVCVFVFTGVLLTL